MHNVHFSQSNQSQMIIIKTLQCFSLNIRFCSEMSDYGSKMGCKTQFRSLNLNKPFKTAGNTVIYDMLVNQNVSFFTYRYLSVNNDFFSKRTLTGLGFHLAFWAALMKADLGNWMGSNRGTKQRNDWISMLSVIIFCLRAEPETNKQIRWSPQQGY